MLKKLLLAIILIDSLLVILSLLRFPLAGILSALPILILLMICLLLAIWAMGRVKPEVQSWGMWFGLIASLILCGEVFLEYILLPANNSPYGLVEYGLLLLTFFVSGLITFRSTPSLIGSAQAGLLAGVLSALIWYGFILLVINIFWGTARQTQIFVAEGEWVDFSSSGVKEFTTFVIQDYFGAGFFHMLLGAIFGAFFGFTGGMIGKIIYRQKNMAPENLQH